MRIRPALEGEASVLSSIAWEAKAFWPYSASQLAAWREELTISARCIAVRPTWVAEIGSRIVGFFVLAPSSATWVLEHCWVLPVGRGRGVGRALLAQALSLAAAGGATALSIDSDPYAEPFYLACGARRVGLVAAPVAGSPGRSRPQLLLFTGQAVASTIAGSPPA
ncbi:MAG: GNAT family N-acetyltransferase [Gammaproteobacteria bacterium]|nr:GNAT family N-acetyltransferase [Gammaproteobacteria bacterium]